MFRNYLKTAWRNLLKNKFYSAINIAGLTLGLCVGILILLWVQDELSFDNFHKKGDNIYKVEIFGGTGSSRQIWTHTVAPIGPMAKQQLPEVKDQVRFTRNWMFSLYKHNDKVFGDEMVAFADPSYFSIFDFPLVEGQTAKPFIDNNSVVVTRSTALKYFGSQNPIGKVITADDKEQFTVSGVINDFPKNTRMAFGMIMPMSYYTKMRLTAGDDINTNFSSFGYETYLLLKPGTSIAALCKKLFNIHISQKADDTDAEYMLQPLSKVHLYNSDGTNKGIETVRIFIIIALVILVIACINYVNLSTARSMLRAKEISMRKILGAAKTQLFMQFIIETALLYSLATILALALIYLVMPAFNQLANKQLVFDMADVHIWKVIALTIIGTLAASSIYPALMLSSFEPLKALKGKISAKIGDVLFRKILVVTQFSFSVLLIIGTLVITGQLNYIRSKNLGYDKSQTLAFWMRDLGSHYDAVRGELMKQPGVLSVTRSSSNLLDNQGITGDNGWDGKQPGQTFIVHPLSIDKDFITSFKMKMAEGKTFTGTVADSSHFILNETAIREAGIKNPIGKAFRMGKINGTIIGVVEDFHFASLKDKIAPSVFYYGPKDYATVYIKTTSKNAQKIVAEAGNMFKQYNGQYPFTPYFLDEVFNKLYKNEQQEGILFNYFAGIAIFISCLGLLGLAAYTAQVRTREIGIRKVLGSSVTGIVGLLATDFIKLVFIAIVIASPVAWYMMNNWLNGFAYKIGISWTVFALAGIIAVVIAFATISIQSVKAALTNPVKSLKSE
jgi:putative ABC transport system permease protein